MATDRPLRSRRVLARSPELSRTLPSWIYRDAALAEREREMIYGRSWAFLGHTSELSSPGARLVRPVEHLTVSVERGGGGALIARVHERVDAGDPGRPARAETVAGLVFVNPDPDTRPLSALAPDLEPSLRDFLPRIGELVPCHETTHDVASNWKVMIENSLECYHCEPCHPGFAGAVDMERYRSTSDGVLTVHASERRLAPGETARDEDRFRYWYIWPTTEIDATPGARPRLSVFTRQALGPERFRLIGRYYRLPGDVPTEAEIRSMEGNATLMEDIAICESVQRGLASRGYDRGRFIVDPERSHMSEHSVHHFQLLVADTLGLR